MMRSRRVRLEPKPASYPKTVGYINNKPPKNWDLGYELVVSFRCPLEESVISEIAGLSNYDTGTDLRTGVRDLMFPCGTDRKLAHRAAKRVWKADYFGALRIKINYPVEHEGKDSFTPWYDVDGKLIERIKHRKLKPRIIRRPLRKKRAA